MEFRKLKAAVEALRFMPEFNGFVWEDEHHRADYEAIEELMAYVDRVDKSANASMDWIIRNYDGEDGLLCRLTAMAESQNRRDAAEANYRLGRMYLGFDRPEGLKMPHLEQIALGFLARATELGHKAAKEQYCILAEHMRFYNAALQAVPDDKYMKAARTAYYRNCVRISEYLGAELPALNENGYFPAKDDAETHEVGKAVLRYAEKMKSRAMDLKQRVEALERGITDQVFRVKDEIVRMARRFEGAKKRSKWIRRLALLAYMILMVMGGLKGPEETPTLIYLAFLLPNTLHIFSEYEISGLQDYLSAIPDEDIRTRQLGVCLVLVPLVYLFITFLLRFISHGGIEKLVDKKAAVLKKKGITQIAEQAQDILRGKDSWDDSDKAFFESLGLKDRYGKTDELAILYHMRQYANDYQFAYRNANPGKENWQWQFIYQPPAGFRQAVKEGRKMICEDVENLPLYERCDKTRDLIGWVLDEMRDRDEKWHVPLWNVDEMQGWGSYWAEDYCKNVLLEIYKSHSDAGDREASYRIGLALYPSVSGRYYAERSQKQGHPKAYNLVCSYDSYGVVPNESSWKKPEPVSSSVGSLLGELLGDAARKLDDYHRERNENEIDKARMLGDISAEEAAKLKDKYGKRKEW